MSKLRTLNVIGGQVGAGAITPTELALNAVIPVKIKANNTPEVGKFLAFLNNGSFSWIFANDPGTIDHNALLNYDSARHRKITELPQMEVLLIEI